MTYQVIYSSQAKRPMSVHDLERILLDAREGNEKRGITGALVYVDGVFLQVLEGEKDAVLDLMKNIASDTRHDAVKVFHALEVAAPMFDGWRMANIDATPEQLAFWAGLPGTASLNAILDELHGDAKRASEFAVRILEAICP